MLGITLILVGFLFVCGGIAWLFRELGWDAFRYLGAVLVGGLFCQIGSSFIPDEYK